MPETPFLVVDPLAVIKLLVKIRLYFILFVRVYVCVYVCVISHDLHALHMRFY